MADSNPFPILPQFQGDYLDAQRKMAIAQALQQQAFSPPEGTEGWNSMRVVPRLNPLSGIAKVGQALLANKAFGGAIDAQRALGQNQWQAIQGMFAGGQDGQGSAQGGQGGQGGYSSMNPSGLSPQAAAMAYMRDPSEYMKDFVAPQLKPTDATLAARQGGFDTAQANQQAFLKSVSQAPAEARPGSYTRMYNAQTGQYGAPQFNPTVPEGGQPVYNSQGQFMGVAPVSGVSDVLSQNEAAKAGGRAQFDIKQGFDANGNPVYTTGAALAGQGGGAPSGGSMFQGYTPPNSNQVRPSLSPGTPELIQGFVKQHQDTLQAAQNAPADIQAFRAIDQAASQAKTGAGFDRAAQWKSLASVIPGIDPNASDKVNADIIHKYSEQVATRNGGRSDAALDAALGSITNSSMSPEAIHELTPSLIGLRMADMNKASAANTWMKQNNGPASLGEFQQKWNAAYDPNV